MRAGYHGTTDPTRLVLPALFPGQDLVTAHLMITSDIMLCGLSLFRGTANLGNAQRARDTNHCLPWRKRSAN